MPTCSIEVSFTTRSMWSTMFSTVVGSLAVTNMRTPVTPITPPFLAPLTIASSVFTVGRARADQVLAVVGQLRAAQAELVEILDVLGLAEHLGVLQADDHR